jgi:hypothetical protein
MYLDKKGSIFESGSIFENKMKIPCQALLIPLSKFINMLFQIHFHKLILKGSMRTNYGIFKCLILILIEHGT